MSPFLKYNKEVSDLDPLKLSSTSFLLSLENHARDAYLSPYNAFLSLHT
jgi:hypothetical protein